MQQYTKAKHGFVLLPRRWVVERDFAWVAHFRRLVCDDERLAATLVGFYGRAFTCHMHASLVWTFQQSK